MDYVFLREGDVMGSCEKFLTTFHLNTTLNTISYLKCTTVNLNQLEQDRQQKKIIFLFT